MNAVAAGAKGYTEIARQRGNSAVTVRNTLYRIQDKLGIRTKQEPMIRAVRSGLLDDDVLGINKQRFQQHLGRQCKPKDQDRGC